MMSLGMANNQVLKLIDNSVRECVDELMALIESA